MNDKILPQTTKDFNHDKQNELIDAINHHTDLIDLIARHLRIDLNK